jgi:murein DD-endopeptidase MepM/ murein hydrolase activator NlpD
MDDLSISLGAGTKNTGEDETASSPESPVEPSGPDRPMGESERQIRSMRGSEQPEPLQDTSTVQAASRSSDGCNGLFGDVRGPSCNQSHDAVDYHAPVGTATYAVTSGTVRTLTMSGYGDSIFLDESAGSTQYLYAHLSGYDAENGDDVAAGEQIGQTGASGNAVADRPHLHFEVHPNGWRDAEDPLNHGFPTPTDERVYDEEQGWHTENFDIEDCDCYAG